MGNLGTEGTRGSGGARNAPPYSFPQRGIGLLTRPMRKPAAVIAALALLMTVAAVPASAATPERSQESIFLIFPDLNHDLVVFWNITRDDFCAWQAGGFQGEPPVTQLVPAQFNATPTGPVIFSWSATSHLELWTLDAGADLSGPCQDTDDSTAPWAVGTAHAANTDNDLDHGASVDAGLNRTDSYGNRGEGTVWDASGDAWHYSWVFRALNDRNHVYREVVPQRSVLTRLG
jgi:hypothetical protein